MEVIVNGEPKELSCIDKNGYDISQKIVETYTHVSRKHGIIVMDEYDYISWMGDFYFLERIIKKLEHNLGDNLPENLNNFIERNW